MNPWNASAMLLGAIVMGFACASAAGEMQFGVAEIQPPVSACVTLPVDDLPSGASVFVVLFTQPPRVLPGRIALKRNEPCPGRADAPGTSYTVPLESAAPVEHELGIAVTGSERGPSIEQGTAVLKLDGGRGVSFHRCASTEGLHLSVRREGRTIWHRYYYLGYDVEPTCSEREGREYTRLGS